MDLQTLLSNVWEENNLPGHPCLELDNDGQIVIYTGMSEDDDGNLVEHDPDEDLEE